MSKLLARVAAPSILGAACLLWVSFSAPGSASFYLATAAALVVWVGAWLLFGDRRALKPEPDAVAQPAAGAAPAESGARQLARGAAMGAALLVVFLLGALVVRHIPMLVAPTEQLLANMQVGTLWATLLTLIANGVGEELYFRDVARRSLDEAFTPRVSFALQVGLYILVTAAMRVPLLLVGSLAIAVLTVWEARRTGKVISAVAVHLVWSVGMAVVLPLVFFG